MLGQRNGFPSQVAQCLLHVIKLRFGTPIADLIEKPPNVADKPLPLAVEIIEGLLRTWTRFVWDIWRGGYCAAVLGLLRHRGGGLDAALHLLHNVTLRSRLELGDLTGGAYREGAVANRFHHFRLPL